MTILGIMSGTSLDGLDLALCDFDIAAGNYHFTIRAGQTIDYPLHLRQRIRSAYQLNAYDYVKLDRELGHFIGKACRGFLDQQDCKPEAIASHGHTVFHDVSEGVTSQIGHGAAIRAESGVPVICDFRSLDIALGGQGAPLVPIGDRLLFSDYGACINLGGISNISFEQGGERLAYDCCAVNMVLNKLANELGHAYDKNGALAEEGQLLPALLDELRQLRYYQQPPPKSLGFEWVEKEIFPLLASARGSSKDFLRTYTHHVAEMLAQEITSHLPGGATVLMTGGGTHNSFLIQQLTTLLPDHRIEVPTRELIDFKEALLFAFLGYLRLQNEANCLKSVTGASRDSSGGAIY